MTPDQITEAHTLVEILNRPYGNLTGAEKRAAAAALTAALDEIERLRGLLDFAVEMTGEPDCWYDHHGYCQAHNLQPKGECWVELARKGGTQ